jgi:putative ABC transport system ATP-binding protein
MSEPIVRLDEVWQTYPLGDTEVHALRGVSLSVARGELLAIVGPSGSGKTSLLQLLGCLVRPSRGQVLLDGLPVADRERTRLRARRIGFVFQTFDLVPYLTARENVLVQLHVAGIPRREAARRADAALDEVGLTARAAHRPRQLSGGERQRVALARAVAKRPALLLADEPTGNLDSEHGAEIAALLGRLHDAGHTIVLVTHDRELAARAERTLTLRDGRWSA